MKPKIDYTIYLVTDKALMSTGTLEEAVEQAIKGGCTLVQLREKDTTSLSFYNTAVKVKAVTDSFNIPLLINDRVDIALAVDAAGVHIGQSDLPAETVRHIIGNDKILGVSASNINEAVQAEKNGADYLGIGAMFSTGTKSDARLTSMESLRDITNTIDLPIIIIGGINKNTIPLFAGTGIDGVAVVSAIIAQENIKSAAEEIKTLFMSTMRC